MTYAPTQSMRDYLDDDSVSSGVIVEMIQKSPLHAKFKKDNELDWSNEMSVGTVAHSVILEGSWDHVEILDFPDWRTNAAKQARDEFRANGMTVILKKDQLKVLEMVKPAMEFIKSEPDLATAFLGVKEASFFTIIEGVAVKCRPDVFNNLGLVVHYKTTSDANPSAFQRTARGLGYGLTLAFYELVLQSFGPVEKSLILAQETSEPFACSLHSYDSQAMEINKEKVRQALRQWKQCEKENKWPSYQGVNEIGLKPWEIQNQESETLTEIW